MLIEDLHDPRVVDETIGDMTTRIALLDDDARKGLLILLYKLVLTVENDEGCAVAFVDEKGDGNLSVIALGNQTLATPILGAAAGLYETMTEHEGPLQ